ncbi:hypothetical protein B0H16DRAFT_1452764 [Mycena metata]|uniref:Uncharacterized protein n=1 Tax=Mycena metata TaxID=1033252 RepID=A0AAD7JP81_9AGAR|nr:hypothetical protein B0H16DRAFT_1452764 [Mycena metata]
MPPGRPPLEPETKASRRREALQRYAEKYSSYTILCHLYHSTLARNREALRESARVRMQQSRKARAKDSSAQTVAKLRAQVSAAKYRESHREQIRAADALRRGSLSLEAVVTPRTPPKAKRTPTATASASSQALPVTPPKARRARTVENVPAATEPPPTAPRRASTPNADVPTALTLPAAPTIATTIDCSPPATSPAATLLPPAQTRAGVPAGLPTKYLGVAAGGRYRYYKFKGEVPTKNQQRTRELWGLRLEENNGEDSDTDIPPGMCGCARTECQREHKNETQNRRDWKVFHLKYDHMF